MEAEKGLCGAESQPESCQRYLRSDKVVATIGGESGPTSPSVFTARTWNVYVVLGCSPSRVTNVLKIPVMLVL